MTHRRLGFGAFALGWTAVAWVAWGYAGSSPLALTMTLLIGAVYGAGAWELWRFHQATAGLRAALAAVPEALPHLADWLVQLPGALQQPVRQRIEGERSALPGPVLAPYLVGLLVLLGMLGTFLGMVVTLNGAVLALESTTDLATIRAALAAPVKGLGLAFGTSVAGVAASAMLGLVAALCRGERLQAAQALDGRIATRLRAFSRGHQREATLDALQQQARGMPALVGQLQALVAGLDRHQQALGERLASGQDRFHQQAEAAYGALAMSVGSSLQHSLAEGARLAGAALQPAAQATLGAMARDSAAFQQQMVATVQAQLDGLAGRFEGAMGVVTGGWAQALARHETTSQAVSHDLQQALTGFAATFEQRSAALLGAVEARQAAGQGESAAALAALTGQLGQQSSALLATLGQQSTTMLAALDQAHTAQRSETTQQEQQRLAAWTTSLAAMTAALQRDWQQAGAQAQGQQAQILQTLAQTAQGLQAQADAQARSTLAELSRLIDTASQAPQAAAELVGQLRQQLSDSLARDTGLLDERSRIMATLAGLLDAVNQAASGQRQAIDALVAGSTGMLGQAGERFSQTVEAQAKQMTALAAQIGSSAVDMASLGDAFGVAVQQFGQSNQALVGQLQRIEVALGKSTARSDEQLAYCVAQAREIIDLSLTSQQQLVDELQRLAHRPALAAGDRLGGGMGESA